jgi:hypothetical protein
VTRLRAWSRLTRWRFESLFGACGKASRLRAFSLSAARSAGLCGADFRDTALWAVGQISARPRACCHERPVRFEPPTLGRAAGTTRVGNARGASPTSLRRVASTSSSATPGRRRDAQARWHGSASSAAQRPRRDHRATVAGRGETPASAPTRPSEVSAGAWRSRRPTGAPQHDAVLRPTARATRHDTLNPIRLSGDVSFFAHTAPVRSAARIGFESSPPCAICSALVAIAGCG